MAGLLYKVAWYLNAPFKAMESIPKVDNFAPLGNNMVMNPVTGRLQQAPGLWDKTKAFFNRNPQLKYVGYGVGGTLATIGAGHLLFGGNNNYQ